MDRIEDYDLKSLTDARSAMVERLVEYLAALEFTVPRAPQTFKFKTVLDTWSDFNQRAMSGGDALPAACVLPDRPIYDADALTPRAFEDTWSGGDPTLCGFDGRPLFPLGDGSGQGFVLYTLSTLTVPFVLLFRTQTKPLRKSIFRRLEQVFIEDGSITPDPSQLNPSIPVDAIAHPVRFGRILEVPQYYNQKARFTLDAAQLLDSESSNGENRFLGQLELTGHMQVCVVRRANAIKTKLTVVVDDLPASPTST